MEVFDRTWLGLLSRLLQNELRHSVSGMGLKDIM